MSMNESWIGRCKKCGFEGRIPPKEEWLDEDCKIDAFYCPECGSYIGQI